MDPSKEAIGERLLQIRKKLEMTQAALALALGCSRVFICNIEKGNSRPSAGVIAGMLSLGMNGSWLMTGQGQMRLSDRPDSSAPSDYPIGVTAGYPNHAGDCPRPDVTDLSEIKGQLAEAQNLLTRIARRIKQMEKPRRG